MNELGNTPTDKNYKPSGISKAEERALEAYPHYTAENITEVTNARHFFVKGYKQAEKDLALTWEDMQLIWQLCDILNSEQPNFYSSKDFFTEVLNRFNKSKEEK